MKIADTLCLFSKQCVENLEHFYCECHISKAIIDGMLPG